MLSCVKLLGFSELVFIHVLEHDVIILTDPCATTFDGIILGFLKPLLLVSEIACQRLPQGERTDPASDSVGCLKNDKVLPMFSEDKSSLQGRYACAYQDIRNVTITLHLIYCCNKYEAIYL